MLYSNVLVSCQLYVEWRRSMNEIFFPPPKDLVGIRPVGILSTDDILDVAMPWSVTGRW